MVTIYSVTMNGELQGSKGDRNGRVPRVGLPSDELRGWHSRGYLPHFDAGDVPQSITFRLAESIPTSLHQQWREELGLGARLSRPPSSSAAAEERRRIETYLNQGIGPLWLSDPRIGSLVESALLFFDGARYRLHAWVVMPNHVHVVITPFVDVSMSQIVSSWKSYTATRANELLGNRGTFWQPDYFDRFIRDERHFLAAVSYVENNPVVAGLCSSPSGWRFSSARRRVSP
jgi:REP element-mobilizing transposase RayT